MAFYYAKLTEAGAALLAAAGPGAPVMLATMKIGDASGAPYDPTGDETALVNVRDTQAIDTFSVDPVDGTVLIAKGIFPAAVGGFTVCEAGVFTDDDVLFAIARIPSTVKPNPADGGGIDMSITLRLRFAGDANITINVDASAIYATRAFVYQTRHYYSVKSATLTEPPADPSEDDCYLVPNAGASGAWAGQANKIAIYIAGAWSFVSLPLSSRAGVAGSATVYRRTNTGWVIDADPVLAARIAAAEDRDALLGKFFAGSFLATTQRSCTGALADIGPQGAATVHTPPGKARVVYVRFTNISADAWADLKIVDTNDGANSGYRAKTYPVPFNTNGSAPDFEVRLVLTPGQKLQHRGSNSGVLVISTAWFEGDLGSFLPTTQLVCGTVYGDPISPFGLDAPETPEGKVRSAFIRLCNIGDADSNAYVYVIDTVTPANANDGPRAHKFPVPYNSPGSAPDFEAPLILPPGFQFQIKADHADTVAASIEWVEVAA